MFSLYDKELFKHVNSFLGLNCAPDILERRFFPNGKEITESQAAYWAADRHLKEEFPYDDKSVHLVSVGDGNTPRTAGLFAFRTKWTCHSIDPNLKDADWRTERLHTYKNRVEELDLYFDRLVIVAVHSHADLAQTLSHIRGDQRALIAIPCCISYEYWPPPDIEYHDPGIWSPKNLVKIWKNI